jgi:hypothetical protein
MKPIKSILIIWMLTLCVPISVYAQSITDIEYLGGVPGYNN